MKERRVREDDRNGFGTMTLPVDGGRGMMDG